MEREGEAGREEKRRQERRFQKSQGCSSVLDSIPNNTRTYTHAHLHTHAKFTVKQCIVLLVAASHLMLTTSLDCSNKPSRVTDLHYVGSDEYTLTFTQ